MSNKNNSKDSQASNSELTKRKSLKKILIGGGAIATAKASSDAWQKPIVDSVVAPAHAQTSIGGGGQPGGGATPA